MVSIGSSFSSGQDTLAALAAQIEQGDASRVRTFKAYARDKPGETIADARYVGDLRPNQNRLNVFSLFTQGNADDNYRFNLKFGGKVHLGMLVDRLDAQRHVSESETAQGLGIQVIQYQGSAHKVIADSDPNAGAAKQVYDQLTGAGADLTAGDSDPDAGAAKEADDQVTGDGADLTPGKYVVRVYRQTDTSPNTEYSYSFQLKSDRYYQDYDTQQFDTPAHPVKSVLDFMTINPAVMLLAENVDATMGAAMVAATRPPTLVTSTDSSIDPRTQLLSAWM
jgi:hypothetical protein